MVEQELVSAISMAELDYIFACNRFGLQVLLLFWFSTLLTVMYLIILLFQTPLQIMIIANKNGFEQNNL